jgi:hypothetical protein
MRGSGPWLKMVFREHRTRTKAQTPAPEHHTLKGGLPQGSLLVSVTIILKTKLVSLNYNIGYKFTEVTHVLTKTSYSSSFFQW